MSKEVIDKAIRESLQSYFADLDGQPPSDMYQMVLQVVERPLLEVVMKKARNNQSRAALWLGINRNTLRKKLSEHSLLGR